MIIRKVFYNSSFLFRFTSIFQAIVAVIILNISLPAQETEMMLSHFTSEDGLSLSGVTQVFQDSRGFIWLGTYNGLNRFDGYNFKIYLPETGNPKSISSFKITAILEDNNGDLWIGTNYGLNRYNWKSEEFTRYFNDSDNPHSISHNEIYSIYEDRTGTIWVGTFDGLNKYDRNNDNFIQLKGMYGKNWDRSPLYAGVETITSICEDYRVQLWLGTWNGITCINEQGNIIKQYPSAKNGFNADALREITCIYEDKSNNLWFGTNGKGLSKYNPKTDNFTNFRTTGAENSLSNDYINVIFQDKLNNIWIGTNNGLNKYNPDRNNFTRMLNDPNRPLSIINNEVLSLYEDKTGIIWIGTAAGVSRFYEPENKFSYYRADKNKPATSLISSRINSVFIDSQNNIWVGTFEGLDEILSGSNRVIHFRHNEGNKNSIGDNFIMSVIQDRSGIIWAGTHQDGLDSYNPKTGEFKAYKYKVNDPQSLSNSGVTSIFEDRAGSLWVGTWWGLNRLDRRTGKFLRYTADTSNHSSLRNNVIWVIYQDSKNMIWVGTDGGGVSEFNPLSNTFTNFYHDTSITNNISNNRVISIFESRDGIMWFGTMDGLDSYNRETGKITIYTQKDGLPGKFINGIEEDDKGNLWIVTEKGLTKFNSSSGLIANYSKRDGIKDIEFSAHVCAKSKNGYMYFGCKNGLMYFHPDSLKEREKTTRVVITDFKIYNKSVPITKPGILNESITSAKSICIPPGNDVITFDFAFLDYFNAKANRFKYRLIGFDKEWNDIGNRNTATYTNLPAGDYTFVVKASNSDLQKSDIETSLKVTIVPVFFQTWWFRILFIFSLIILTFLIILERTRKIRKHNKVLENRVAERTKDLDATINELNQEIVERKKAEEKVQTSLNEKEVLLKEIHHRVKNNLQIISSLLYLQSKPIIDKTTLGLFQDSQNRIKSMALIHEKLYQSKDFARINFDEYTNSLVDYLKRSYNNTELTIKNYININTEINLNLDTAICCGLIVNELMTNAYKYAFPYEWGKQKSITEELKIEINSDIEEGNRYTLSVTDNGIGIPEDLDIQNSASLGLKIVNSMVNQLEGSVEILRNRGTQFLIKFSDLK